MILLIYLLNMCLLSQVINASKSENNIVMSGGGHGGCKDGGGGGGGGGGGALVMQSGKKGRAVLMECAFHGIRKVILRF